MSSHALHEHEHWKKISAPDDQLTRAVTRGHLPSTSRRLPRKIIRWVIGSIGCQCFLAIQPTTTPLVGGPGLRSDDFHGCSSHRIGFITIGHEDANENPDSERLQMKLPDTITRIKLLGPKRIFYSKPSKVLQQVPQKRSCHLLSSANSTRPSSCCFGAKILAYVLDECEYSEVYHAQTQHQISV